MKLKMKFFVYIILLFSLFSCSLYENKTRLYDAYINNNEILVKDFSVSINDFTFERLAIYDKYEYLIGFSIDLKGLSLERVNISINDYMVIREKNNAQYSLEVYPAMKDINFYLDYERTNSIIFLGYLPTNPEYDNYCVSLEINNKKYKFYLYDYLPYNVDFVIDGEHQGSIGASNTTIMSDISWVSFDYLNGCNEFYYDSDYMNKANPNDLIKQDTILYGRKNRIFEITDDNYIKKVNFVPNTKELVIPREYNGEKITRILSLTFLCDEIEKMEKLCIPKEIDFISPSSMIGLAINLKEILYEGTSAQWDYLMTISLSSNINIICGLYLESGGQ